jgi:hypothetical protein
MTKKLQVPVEVVKAIKNLEERYDWDQLTFLNFDRIEKLAKLNVNVNSEAIQKFIDTHSKLDFATIILSNDWEVEQTVEDKLRFEFSSHHRDSAFTRGVRFGMVKATQIWAEKYPEMKGVLPPDGE